MSVRFFKLSNFYNIINALIIKCISNELSVGQRRSNQPPQVTFIIWPTHLDPTLVQARILYCIVQI